jgi:hypothetical protein
LFIILAPVAGLVMLTNYVVDPANVFRNDAFVKGIAAVLAKGHNVDNLSNYDERKLQQEMISTINYTPDVVVEGSSRIMELGEEFYPAKKLLNCGVSHGNINDIIAITGLLDSLNKMPPVLIIGVDPSLLDKGTDEWEVLYPFYRYAMRNILMDEPQESERKRLFLKKATALMSFSYFKSSVDFLLHDKKGSYKDVGMSAPGNGGRFSDGTVCYTYAYAHPDTKRMAADAIKGADETGMNEIDTVKLQALTTLIRKLQARNVSVRLVMVPYHPDYYKEINRKTGNLLPRSEKMYRELAYNLKAPIAGSLNPATYNLDGSYFYDRWHCNKDALQRIFQLQ